MLKLVTTDSLLNRGRDALNDEQATTWYYNMMHDHLIKVYNMNLRSLLIKDNQ